ncbi:hypothetical protein AVEN_77603-1 [Araneus ventricosus]|uniref:Uncharacterized protein n=1 Tax=Araneus ventricosus TaxID=182803 RepID=A0A4Y2QQC3_ARAVE|nr:hypothetical protein AVEN_77603-1 [Araneus ventricosus]
MALQARSLSSSHVYELTKTVPSFDSKNGDITLFLSLFERQAKRAQIDTKDWVSGLLMLMPSDIVQLIARESEENFNYNYIKSVLLKIQIETRIQEEIPSPPEEFGEILARIYF